MLAQLVVGRAVRLAQPGAQVVGVEHRHVGDLAQIRAVQLDVVPRLEHHSEVAEEARHAANGLLGLDEAVLIPALRRDRVGPERGKLCGAGDGSAAGTAAAVRGGEGLVQVEVHHVHTRVGGAQAAHVGVHVRAVHVQERALLVQYRGDLGDVALVDAARIRVRDHQGRGRLVDFLAKLVHVDAAVFVQADLLGLEPGHRGGRRIRPVRRLGHEHGGAPLVALILEVPLHHQDAR